MSLNGVPCDLVGELEHYEAEAGKKKLCDAYFVKAKAMLAGSRPVQAKKVTTEQLEQSYINVLMLLDVQLKHPTRRFQPVGFHHWHFFLPPATVDHCILDVKDICNTIFFCARRLHRMSSHMTIKGASS